MKPQVGRSAPSPFISLAPGVAQSAVIGALAMGLRFLPGFEFFSPLILAALIGIFWRNVFGLGSRNVDGVRFCASTVLRVAVVLLGLQLSLTQVAQVGYKGVVILAVTVAATIAFTRWVGRRLGVESSLTDLIAVGTGICGASAIVALKSVTNARDADVAYAIASITIFGTIAMFSYPAIGRGLALSSTEYGFWAGSTIQEVAQVVGATFQFDATAGESGTIVKLTRVLMLGPVAFLFARRNSLSENRRFGEVAYAVPWFLAGFAVAVLVNSFLPIGLELRSAIGWFTTFLFSSALGALGLEIHFSQLRARGFRPLALGLLSSVFVAVLGLLFLPILG